MLLLSKEWCWKNNGSAVKTDCTDEEANLSLFLFSFLLDSITSTEIRWKPKQTWCVTSRGVGKAEQRDRCLGSARKTWILHEARELPRERAGPETCPRNDDENASFAAKLTTIACFAMDIEKIVSPARVALDYAEWSESRRDDTTTTRKILSFQWPLRARALSRKAGRKELAWPIR